MIRETTQSDLEEVFNLIHSAFGDRSESDLVKQLISDGDVLINLLFESSGSIIGNVVVSKITMRPDLDLFVEELLLFQSYLINNLLELVQNLWQKQSIKVRKWG